MYIYVYICIYICILYCICIVFFEIWIGYVWGYVPYAVSWVPADLISECKSMMNLHGSQYM